MDLKRHAETKLNQYAQKIIDGGVKTDDHAFGELTFYISLQRVLSGSASRQDLGMMDAINDTLQELGLVERGKTFFKN
jgi:hypothetical protein